MEPWSASIAGRVLFQVNAIHWATIHAYPFFVPYRSTAVRQVPPIFFAFGSLLLMMFVQVYFRSNSGSSQTSM